MAIPGRRGHAFNMKPSPLAGSALRVAGGLLLCAACFQSGRWYQELSVSVSGRPAAKGDPGNEMVSATFRAKAEPAVPMAEPAPLVSSGDPVGHGGDIITPLNVRDPSALVMGPGISRQECLPPPSLETVSPSREVKPRKMRHGLLLELLKKSDKSSADPKSF